MHRLHLRDLVNALTPHLRCRSARQQFVSSSLGTNNPWLTGLDWQGDTAEFTMMLVLHCLPAIGGNDQPCPLTRLLLRARAHCSRAQLLEIDRLLAALISPAMLAEQRVF